VIGAHELVPKKSTHMTKVLRRKEGSHDGKTLRWVAALWDPLHRITIKSKGHVTMPTYSLNILGKVAKVRVK